MQIFQIFHITQLSLRYNNILTQVYLPLNDAFGLSTLEHTSCPCSQLTHKSFNWQKSTHNEINQTTNLKQIYPQQAEALLVLLLFKAKCALPDDIALRNWWHLTQCATWDQTLGLVNSTYIRSILCEIGIAKLDSPCVSTATSMTTLICCNKTTTPTTWQQQQQMQYLCPPNVFNIVPRMPSQMHIRPEVVLVATWHHVCKGCLYESACLFFTLTV